jgi:hypothetical protein
MVLVAIKANKTMRKRAEQLLGKRLNEYFISGRQLKIIHAAGVASIFSTNHSKKILLAL